MENELKEEGKEARIKMKEQDSIKEPYQGLPVIY
jgi:hypothetical protein